MSYNITAPGSGTSFQVSIIGILLGIFIPFILYYLIDNFGKGRSNRYLGRSSRESFTKYIPYFVGMFLLIIFVRNTTKSPEAYIDVSNNTSDRINLTKPRMSNITYEMELNISPSNLTNSSVFDIDDISTGDLNDLDILD